MAIIPEKQSSGGLKTHHYGSILAVGAVGGIVAYLLFHFIIGLVWHVIEIAVIVAVIYLIVRFLIRRAIDR